MLLDLSDYATLKTYFQDIATSHVDIDNFFDGENEAFNNSLKSSEYSTVLWLYPYEQISIVDNLSDNHYANHPVTIYLYAKSDDESFAKRKEKYEELVGIAKQIMAKMLIDFWNGDIMTTMNGYQYGMTDDVRGANKFVGCRLDINFQYPARLMYNESKWT